MNEAAPGAGAAVRLRPVGAGEVRPQARRPVAALAACALVALAALVAGCGEEDPLANVSDTETLGPASAEGDVEQSPATLRAEDGYTTLVTTDITTRGTAAALIASQVALPDSGAAELRLMVDGEVERDAEIHETSSDDTRVAVISCKCKLAPGEHTIVVEGTASSGTATVGARTLVVFDEVSFEGTSGPAIAESDLVTEDATVDAEGTDLAQTPAGSGSGPALVIGSIAAPRSQTGADNVRLSVTVGDDEADELATTKIPGGKLNAYLDDNGAGEEVAMRGFITEGEIDVGASSLLVCNCDVGR